MMTRDQFVRQISQEQAALRRFLTALCCGNSTTADDMAQDTLLKAGSVEKRWGNFLS